MSPIENLLPTIEPSPGDPSTKQNRSRDLFGVQLEVKF